MGTTQSSLPANMDNTSNKDDDIVYDQANTLRAAAVMEGDGSVLDEHYTFEEYIHRRGTYLGRLPEYSKIPNACFIARHHAAEIFDDEKQLLKVEEVRMRELEHEFDPLLPLPTTSNTATIDSFKTCPPIGVIYETKDEYNDETSQSPKALAGNAIHSTPATSPIENEAVDKQEAMQAGPQQAIASGTNLFPIDPELVDLTTPGLQQRAVYPQFFAAQATYPSFSTHFQAPQAYMTGAGALHRPPPIYAYSTQGILPTPVNGISVNGDAGNSSAPNKNAANDAPSTAAAPATSPTLTTSPAQKVFTPDPRVTSMARFGIVQGVKATKRNFPPEPEQLVYPAAPPSQAIDPAPQPTSQTMASTNAPFRAASSLPEEPVEDIQPGEPPVKRQRLARGVAQKTKKAAATSTEPESKSSDKSTAAKASKTSKSKPVKEAPTNKAQHLESVITGAALPTSRAEAAAAAEEHHQRLLTAHNKRKSIPARRAAKTTPDLLPFFFDPANFDNEGSNVRCICGCVDEDGGEMGDQMVQCEKCEVWQHYACVLPGMNEAQVEKLGTYECTVCNPWERRVVLQNLRRNDGKL